MNTRSEAWFTGSLLRLMLGVLAYSLFWLSPSSGSAAGKLEVRASLWSYESLCNFKDSPNWPKKWAIGAGESLSFTVTGCGALEKEYGHPPAVRFTIENHREQETQIPIAGFASIALKTKKGKTVPPIAFRHRDRDSFGGGYAANFNSEFIGKWTLILAPGEVVDLLLFFSETSVGDSVIVGDGLQAKIE